MSAAAHLVDKVVGPEARTEVDRGVPVLVHVGSPDRVRQAVSGPEEGSGAQALELEETQSLVGLGQPPDVLGTVDCASDGTLGVLLGVLHGSTLPQLCDVCTARELRTPRTLPVRSRGPWQLRSRPERSGRRPQRPGPR